MRYTITKDFHFEAAHWLTGLAEDHPCARAHGHSYRVRVELAADELDGHGFVLDYGDLKPFGRWIDANLDHQLLNEVVRFQPSAENLARYLHGILLQEVVIPRGVVAAVGVSETAKSWAWYRP